MLKKLEEKAKKILEKENDVSKIRSGDFISVFKKIGTYKSTNKTLNIKPDLVVEYFKGGIDYVFLEPSIFNCFAIMSKFVVFNEIKIPLDVKRLIFFFEENEPLYNIKESGLLDSESKYRIEDVWGNFLEVAKWFSEKIKKEIVIKRIE